MIKTSPSLDAFRYGFTIYESVEEALKKPKAVKRLRLHGKGWDVAGLPVETFSELLKLTVNLREIQIAWQSWTSLPKELSNLPQLRRVTVLNTPIQSFPDFLKACPHLEELVLRGTEIQEIPESIGEFRKLRSLDVSNSQLRFVPEKLIRLPALNRLQLHATQIPIETADRLRQSTNLEILITNHPLLKVSS